MSSRLSKTVARAGKGRFIPVKQDVGPISTLDMGRFAMLQTVGLQERRQQMNVLQKITSFNELRLHPNLRARISMLLKDMPPTPVQKVAMKVLGVGKQDKLKATLIAAETGSGKTLSYLGPLLTEILTNKTTSHPDPAILSQNNSPSEIGNGSIESPIESSIERGNEMGNETQLGNKYIDESSVEKSTFNEPLNDANKETEPENEIVANKQFKSEARGIKSIVLVPTLELANQVVSTALNLCPDLRIARFSGQTDFVEDFARKMNAGVDLVVGTPAKFLKLLKNHPQQTKKALSECKFMVVDEADTLINPSFVGETTAVVDRCINAANLVFVTATIPKSFDRYLRAEFPSIQRVVTPSIHRMPRHIEFRVIEVWRSPYHDDKNLALRQLLYAIYHDNTEPGKVKRVVVFVNKREDVEKVVEVLNSTGFEATSLLTPKPDHRAEILDRFVSKDALNEGVMKILVATDVAARGIDFKDLKNVVLYDVPFTAADLLHRAGRTGRLGRKGRVFVLASQRESKGWLKGLEKVVKRGMALA